MSLVKALEKSLNREKTREIEEKFQDLNESLVKCLCYSKFLIAIGKKTSLKNLYENYESLKSHQKIEHDDLITNVEDLFKNAEGLMNSFKFEIIKAIDDKIAFLDFLIQIKIDKEKTKKAKNLKGIYKEIKKLTNSRISRNLDAETYQNQFDEHIEQMQNNQIDIENISDSDAISRFVNLYYTKTQKGQNITLSDINDIIEDLSDSEIANKIILRFR